MKIAIHYTEDIYKDNFSRKWIEYFQSNYNIDILTLNFKQSELIHKITKCNGIMWHWFHTPDDKICAPKILDAIEYALHIPIFPNKETRWHYDEKIAQHYFIDSLNISKIKSWVFWNHSDASNFISFCKYPIIFKLSVGAGSANIIKLESYDEAKDIIDKMFNNGFYPYTINEFNNSTIDFDKHWYYLKQKNYVYFQEFIPANNYDIRITVIGNRAFAFIRYNRENDFRASGSGNIDYDINKVPLKAIEISHKISKEYNFQSMAYDFLQYPYKDEILLNEISYCYVNTLVYNCPGYWDRNLKFHEGNIWPEYAQAEDFIYYITKGKLI